jgi:RimJ/RimL family protein N-acetyltransferase
MNGEGETSNVRLRAVEATDVETWREWINDPMVMEGLDRVLPATAEEHSQFIQRHIAGNANSIWFSVDAQDGTYVGNIWIWDLHWRHRRAEVRLFVGHPEYAMRGIGSAAIRQIATYAFATLGLQKLYAYVHASNTRSKRAFERAGFVEEALLRDEAFRDGKRSDVWRMCRLAPST